MLLAFDDTDSPNGGCTTALVGPIVDALGGADVLDGLPRLVRLDPSHPWKTRGNAAVVVPLQDRRSPDEVLRLAFEVVQRQATVSEGKGAGVIVFGEPPDEQWYWRGVQGRVPRKAVEPLLDDNPHASLGTGRGLIGATCAAAWRPERVTYEHIAYRSPARIGEPREVEAASLVAVQRYHPTTYACVDDRGRPVMVPRTPCPVLYGLRATRLEGLREAASAIVSEPVARHTTFVTNHASDDHVTEACLAWLRVRERPRARRGGHVLVRCETEHGERRDCIAFEPTGALRQAVLGMGEGDRILPVGTFRDGCVNLEKVLHRPAARLVRTPCPSCGTAMRSTGRNAPRKCDRCGRLGHARQGQDAPFWYEADASAWRHLARPLALGLAPRIARAAEGESDGIQRRGLVH